MIPLLQFFNFITDTTYQQKYLDRDSWQWKVKRAYRNTHSSNSPQLHIDISIKVHGVRVLYFCIIVYQILYTEIAHPILWWTAKQPSAACERLTRSKY